MTDWNAAEDHVDRALELFKRGRLDEAEKALRMALEIAPDRGDWLFNLALTLDASGRLNEAIDCYMAAVAALPEEGEIKASAGIALSKADRREEALAMLKQACAMEPTCEEAWAHQIDVLSHMEQHEEAEAAYFLAQQYLDEYPNCLFAMGESLFARGELDRAAWCFREAANQDPSLPRVRARLGAVLAKSGRTHRAVRMYLQDLREDPGSAQTLLEFGDLLVTLGRHGEAEEKYRRVLELQPADISAHQRLAQLSIRMGRHDQAISELELVRSLDPDDESVILHLAGCLISVKRTREARSLLVEHAELLSREAERDATAQLCDLLLAAGLPGITADILVKAIVRFPDDIGLLRRLAFARFDGGNTRGGDRVSRQLIRRNPTLGSTHENLVLSALKLNAPHLARMRLNRALSTCSGDERIRRLRVLLLLRWTPLMLRGLRNSASRLPIIGRIFS
jgi:tetratricopeptide (TPR) repeat protein